MRKKLLIIGALAGLLALGTTIGVAVAQTATPTPTASPTPAATTTPSQSVMNARDKAFADELAKILGLDAAKVESAVTQARQSSRHAQVDAAVKARLDRLVKAGTLTQADEDAIVTWFQSRPAAADKIVDQFMGRGPLGGRWGFRGHFHR